MADDIVMSIQRCGVVLNTLMAPPFEFMYFMGLEMIICRCVISVSEMFRSWPSCVPKTVTAELQKCTMLW